MEKTRHFGKAIWHHIATVCWHSTISLLLLGVNSRLRGFGSFILITSQRRFLKSTDFPNANSSIFSPIQTPKERSRTVATFPLGVGGQGQIVVLETGCQIEGPQNGDIKDLFKKGIIATGNVTPSASFLLLPFMSSSSWHKPKETFRKITRVGSTGLQPKLGVFGTWVLTRAAFHAESHPAFHPEDPSLTPPPR